MKIIFIFLFLILSVIVFSQTRNVKGKVLDDNRKPVENLNLRFTSIGDFVTTGSGEFIISVPEGTNYVDIVIKDDEYQLLYPVDAKIPVTEDQDFISTVLVTKKNSSEKGIDVSIRKFNRLEEMLKDIGSTSSELQDFLKKYIEIESRRLAIDEMRLEEEFAKAGVRDEIFSEVTPYLSEIILRLKNLKTTFKMNYELAFYNNAGIENLNKAIKEYNPVFDTIYSENKSWQKSIEKGWNENLSEKFSSTIDYFIDELHQPYVFRLNESIILINKIKLQLFADDLMDEMKNKVRRDVNSILSDLDIRIPILEERINEIINRLQFTDIN